MCGRSPLYQSKKRNTSRRNAEASNGPVASAQTSALQRVDQSLDNRDAAMPANRAAALADAMALAPALEPSRRELHTRVGHKILGRSADLADDPAEKTAELFRVG